MEYVLFCKIKIGRRMWWENITVVDQILSSKLMVAWKIINIIGDNTSRIKTTFEICFRKRKKKKKKKICL